MTEERIKELLQNADRAAGPPSFGRVTADGIERRIQRRRLVWVGIPAAAAAVVLLALGLWATSNRPGKPGAQQQQQIASLQDQVKQLQAQTNATLRLVQDVLAKDRQNQRLAALEAELARIPDPMVELAKQTDKTAFILLRQAEQLYYELNQTESAVEAYKQIIQRFPQNQWADVARERLTEIEKRRINKSNTQGDSKCGLQSV
ncbi:MAG: tetratricopeptide repeat protein [Planctomycetota bacterium]